MDMRPIREQEADSGAETERPNVTPTAETAIAELPEAVLMVLATSREGTNE